MLEKSDRGSNFAVDARSQHTLRRSSRFLSSCSLQMPKKSDRSSSISVDAISYRTLRRSSRFLSSCSSQMPKNSDRRSSVSVDVLSHHTLRRSPRLISSEMIEGDSSSLQHIYGKESGECNSVNLLKGFRKLNSRSSFRVGSCQAPLRRSARFLLPEKLKSAETLSNSISISSKLTQKASDFGMVLEEAQNDYRRSPRLASETETKDFEIPQSFPMAKQKRQSPSLLGKVSVSAENVKQGIKYFNASNEVDKKLQKIDCEIANSKILRRSMRLVSVTATGSKKCNEHEVIVKSKPKKTLKKDCVYMTSQIQKPSRRLRITSNGVLKKGATLNLTDKEKEVSKRPNGDRGSLVLETRTDDGFLSTKTTEHHKDKKRKLEEDNGVKNKIAKIENANCHVTVAWTIEQEAALQKAYIIAKPTPHFWKKVSRMVPGKSAQDCFDKIFSSMATPLSSRFQTKTQRKNLSPICNFSLSDNISPQVSELKVGRLGRARTKKLAAQKISRHLLRKHYRTDQAEAIDCFSLLEPSPIKITSIAHDIQSPETSSLTFDSPLLPHTGDKLSFNSDLVSRFKLASSNDPSPEVLKRIKNRALHDRYIDQLHHRDARRAVLAKKSNHGTVGKPVHGGLRAARTALISDAISFAKHFRDSQENTMDGSEADEHDDFFDNDEDIDADE